MTTLVEIADELYGLPLDDFTAARNARARELRSGDRALAQEVTRLPKPSLAAWAVNVLIRAKRHEVEQALELGATLRQAQQDLDAAAMRELTTQRRRLVSALARQATAATGELGRAVRGAALDEVEQTLNAGLVDADAATAVRTARLVRALGSVGLEPVDLTDAVAAQAGDATRAGSGGSRASDQEPRTRRSSGRNGSTGTPPDADAAREQEAERLARERAERVAVVERAVRDARRDLGDAEQHLDTADGAARRAARERDARRDDVDDLRERLDQLQRRLDAAQRGFDDALREVDSAQAEQRDAARGRDAARAALEQAQRSLERLTRDG